MTEFNKLRDNYIKENPNIAFENHALREKTLTKKEFIDELKKTGVDITPRTVAFYISENIIPKPKIGPKKDGRGKESYFSYSDVSKVAVFKELQKQGKTIKQIKEIWYIAYDTIELNFIKNDDAFLNRFVNLAHIFVENFPNQITRKSFTEYTGIKDSERANLCFDLAKAILMLQEVGFKVAKEIFRFDQLVLYYNFFYIYFDQALETMYFIERYNENKHRDFVSMSAVCSLITEQSKTALISLYLNALVKFLTSIIETKTTKGKIPEELGMEIKNALLEVTNSLTNAVNILSDTVEE